MLRASDKPVVSDRSQACLVVSSHPAQPSTTAVAQTIVPLTEAVRAYAAAGNTPRKETRLIVAEIRFESMRLFLMVMRRGYGSARWRMHRDSLRRWRGRSYLSTDREIVSGGHGKWESGESDVAVLRAELRSTDARGRSVRPDRCRACASSRSPADAKKNLPSVPRGCAPTGEGDLQPCLVGRNGFASQRIARRRKSVCIACESSDSAIRQIH
jgi:hypothetical protein